MYSLLVSSLLAAAVSSTPDTCQLGGRAEHAPPGTWAYVYPPEGKLVSANCLDSAQLDAKGRFALRVPLSAGPEYYRLQFTGERGYWPVPLAPGRRLTFAGDMRPTGPVKSMQGKFTGSAETELEKEFLSLFFAAFTAKREGKLANVAREQLRMRQLVRRHLESFQAAFWTYAYLTQDPDQRVFVDSVTAVLQLRQPDSRFVRKLLSRQQRAPQLQPGQPAPAFALATALSADSLRLHGLRGRYVVLHFWYPTDQQSKKDKWAAGGRPVDLVPFYEQWRGRGVELVSVSFTPDQLLWRAAVQREPAVTWPQASEPRGFRGPLAESYNVNKAPCFVLIDSEGKLLGTGLELVELDQQLRQLLP